MQQSGAADVDASMPDSDKDGLCDATEEELGTDPHAIDTDGDNLPDIIEVGYAFDPTDPTSPASDQVNLLAAQAGAVADVQARLTVTGDGQGLSGAFEPISSIYTDGSSAEDFFVGAQAVSADPIDGVRSIDANAARFASVLGRARLAFGLRFEYPADGSTRTCAKAYPYRYSVKADDGSNAAERLFLLVLSPGGKALPQISFCLPHSCQ